MTKATLKSIRKAALSAPHAFCFRDANYWRRFRAEFPEFRPLSGRQAPYAPAADALIPPSACAPGRCWPSPALRRPSPLVAFFSRPR